LPKIPLVPLEVPSDLLQRRPDVVEAKEKLVSAYAQIGVAQAAFFPSLKITAASLGFLSSKVENLFQAHSLAWSAGIGMSIPLFTGGRNVAQLKYAEAMVKDMQAAYQQTVLTAVREVQDAMTNIQYRAEQDGVQKRLLHSSRLSADMSKELYKKGLTTYINVITADRAVLDAENTYLTITSQRLLYSISLIKALGGGWKGGY
jgi:outer membrane protein, multidrug efflux system